MQLTKEVILARIDISYHDKAEAIYKITKQEVLKGKLIKQSNTALSKHLDSTTIYLLNSERFNELYKNTTISFSTYKTSSYFNENKHASGFTDQKGSIKLLYTFRIYTYKFKNDLHFLVPRLNKQEIISFFTYDLYKDIFIHELTHYLQIHKRLYFESPFKNADNDYFKQRIEREAYLNSFIGDLKNIIIKNPEKYLQSLNDFKNLIKYELRNGGNAKDILDNLSNTTREQYYIDVYEYFRKKYKQGLNT